MTTAARLYAALVAVVVGFQFLVILGAPVGHLTQGGRFQGSLPPAGRVTALLSALLLVAMAHVVLARAALVLPRLAAARPAAIWVVVAIGTVSALANLITPSSSERLIWAPVTLVMLVCAIRVARG